MLSFQKRQVAVWENYKKDPADRIVVTVGAHRLLGKHYTFILKQHTSGNEWVLDVERSTLPPNFRQYQERNQFYLRRKDDRSSVDEPGDDTLHYLLWPVNTHMLFIGSPLRLYARTDDYRFSWNSGVGEYRTDGNVIDVKVSTA